MYQEQFLRRYARDRFYHIEIQFYMFSILSLLVTKDFNGPRASMLD
jgi:hypothetical protein